MPARPAVPRVALIAAALLLLASVGCGSSATTSTGPSPQVRCALTLNLPDQVIPAGGGGGTIGVSATRECTWTVSVEGPWLSLKSAQNGQGDGTVEFAAAANPDPVMRRGALVLNGQRAEITQAAAVCDISLVENAASFTPAGGPGRVNVRASSQLCTWTATSEASWIEIRSGSEGRGSGSVLFDVTPTTGPPRSGTLTIAGQRFSVTQSEGCTYSITPAAHGAPAAGGSGRVVVNTSPGCPWIAAGNVPWITVSPGAGSGPGPVTFSVESTNGPERVGTALIAGNLLTVSQAPGCTYDVQPRNHTAAASGGTVTVNVSSASGCPWSAASQASWISIQGVATGSGPGTVTLSIPSTNGPQRSGVVIVAGHQVVVTQSQGCTYSISPTQESIAAAGGSGRITVTAGDGCTWTARNDVAWITVQGGSGSGNGTVTYSVAATSGPGRTGTLTVAGHKFTVTQGQGCTYTINPAQESIPSSGGSGRVGVTTADGCAWTATNNNPSFISIVSGSSGTGSGSVQYNVAATNGPARLGTLTIAGHTFTVNQGQGCTYAVMPASASVEAAGGPTSFEVQTAAGCPWTATTQLPWIAIAPATGTGTGTVQLTIAANDGPVRTGPVTVNTATFTVTQASGCTYSLSPTSANVPASGGPGTVNVLTANGCPWTATSSELWLSIPNPTTGSGNGSVPFTVAVNSGAARAATLTIATQTFTVNQASGCTYTVAPETIAAPAAGRTERVEVTAANGCTWNASTNIAWIQIPGSGGGSGNGHVELVIAANTGPARTGPVTVANRTVTVNQASGCTFAIEPAGITVSSAGGMQSVNVSAGNGCEWTAASPDSWIVVTNGQTGTGNGSVQLTIQPNTSGAARSGTATIAGRTFTVDQSK